MIDNNDYKSYDYKKIVVKNNNVSFYIDSYENFGWLIDGNIPIKSERGQSLIQFKRDKNIINKMELTRLERNFEACMLEIDKLNASITEEPTMITIVIGLIGTMCIAGSVMAISFNQKIIWLSILLAIPGLLGWILPYFIYTNGIKKRTVKVTPFLLEKYEEIDEICHKGHDLL